MFAEQICSFREAAAWMHPDVFMAVKAQTVFVLPPSMSHSFLLSICTQMFTKQLFLSNSSINTNLFCTFTSLIFSFLSF